MNVLKHDITKLKSIKQYADMIGKDRQRVYQMIKEGKIISVEIGGTRFVLID